MKISELLKRKPTQLYTDATKIPTQEEQTTPLPTQIPHSLRNTQMLRVDNHSSPLVDRIPPLPPHTLHFTKASKALNNQVKEKPLPPTQPSQRDQTGRASTVQPTQLKHSSTQAQPPQLEASRPDKPTQLDVTRRPTQWNIASVAQPPQLEANRPDKPTQLEESRRPTQWDMKATPASMANTNPVLVEAEQQPVNGVEYPAKKTPLPTQPSRLGKSNNYSLN